MTSTQKIMAAYQTANQEARSRTKTKNSEYWMAIGRMGGLRIAAELTCDHKEFHTVDTSGGAVDICDTCLSCIT